MMGNEFSDLCPYPKEEIAPAMKRIAQSEYFEKMAAFVFPDSKVEDVRRMVADIVSTDEFQAKVMSALNEQVIQHSIQNFSYDGLQYLEPSKGYLFVSSHRDVMLDSALLQQVLYKNGQPTTEITFGSNLMMSQLIIDIGKSNKMFTVVRGASMRDFYKHSLHLSEYIRDAITQRNTSVWIAQRNGRTKDGNDATDQGIIKMFSMSGTADVVKSINDLNIVPMVVSYQIEPSDLLKTKEIYIKTKEGKYEKPAGEDYTSLIQGLLDPKGDVDVTICEPIRKEELEFPNLSNPNDFFKNVANLIDKRIIDKYQLSNNNYIAHDLRSGSNQYASHYTEAEKNTFAQRYHAALNLPLEDKDLLSSIFLGIYANPVDRKWRIEN
ncbi:MAG: acyltransferase [Bacteroidales bacterium]|nr:acyltransferase [Bacteroidales bacterium]